MQTIKEYCVAESLEEAYTLIQKKTNAIVAGNQWLRLSRTKINTAIDLSKLNLDRIEEKDDCFIIGAMVTLRELETSEALNRCFNGTFREALKSIVGVQFRNTATIGGSVFGRFGFSDILTLLLSMDTEVELYKEGRLALSEFAGRTSHERDILKSIIIKKNSSGYIYQSVRNTATDFPVLAHAASFDKEKGILIMAVGARPARAKRIELILTEEDKADITSLVDRVTKEVNSSMSFGSNMRGSASYRKRLSEVLSRRALERLI